ncbi:hypothetical protein BBJ28_00002302 [Nothophytophthora sp. Chile5]|nr:hypothetical protein BBJ28_00002302 [Nothophytophthora sp. Chile5]
MTTTRPPNKKALLLDGVTGEELFARGLPDDRQIWSATALVHEQHHALLLQVHEAFLRAGADCITCNNYGVTPGVGFSDQEIAQYTAVAGRLARDACEQRTKLAPEATTPTINGSLPPLLESYRADRVPDHDEGVRLYAIIARALRPFADCYLAETLSSVHEAQMALLGVQQAWNDADDDCEKPAAMVSLTLNSRGYLRSGESAYDAVEKLLAFTDGTGGEQWMPELRGILFNCSQPETISKALKELHDDKNTRTNLRERHVRLGGYANRLTTIPDNWALADSREPQALRTDLAVERYAEFVAEWVALGAEIVGGCCGIGPEYIASIHRMLQDQDQR